MLRSATRQRHAFSKSLSSDLTTDPLPPSTALPPHPHRRFYSFRPARPHCRSRGLEPRRRSPHHGSLLHARSTPPERVGPSSSPSQLRSAFYRHRSSLRSCRRGELALPRSSSSRPSPSQLRDAQAPARQGPVLHGAEIPVVDRFSFSS